MPAMILIHGTNVGTAPHMSPRTVDSSSRGYRCKQAKLIRTALRAGRLSLAAPAGAKS